MNSFYPNNRPPLAPSALSFLPLGSVKPKGWLRKQLEIQAASLTGNLPKFWDSVGPSSGWLGGDGESWERGPYYLDGLIPLAYLLEDKDLIAEANKWLDWTLSSQDELGHIGPKILTDWWPCGVILKVLTQYQEATRDRRVIPLMERFFTYMARELPFNHLRAWGIMRWADTALSIIWLYNRSGDPALLDLARDVMSQGYNWTHHFHDFGYTQKQALRFPLTTHVVNNAMAVKTPAVAYVLTKWDEHRTGSHRAIEMLDTYHGTAVGIFTGDEHYAGKNPSQGTELCAVVEYLFSLENLIEVFGDPAFGDRLERIAYNALPGTFSADMWAHQYDQQANQVLCTIDKRRWTNNSDASNIFGLEPNYGCCTANMHQGWPKFAANLWMATPDDGLAAVAYGPCEVTAKVRGGKQVTLEVETDYPFDETVRITVRTPDEVEFPLSLRIPAWATGASITDRSGGAPSRQSGRSGAAPSRQSGRSGGAPSRHPENAEPGTFHTITRKWSDGDTIELTLPMPIEVERRYHDSVTIKRGPLVYSLKIGERWEKIRGEEPHADYAVHPTTPWNYGLSIDPDDPQVEIAKKGVGDLVYGPDAAPIEIRLKGRRVPEWGMEHNSAGELPQSPVKSSEPVEELTLIPYGCAKLRITEFPLLEE